MYVLPLLGDSHWERARRRHHWHPTSHGPPASSQVPGCPHGLRGNHTMDLLRQLPKPLHAHLKWPRFQLSDAPPLLPIKGTSHVSGAFCCHAHITLLHFTPVNPFISVATHFFLPSLLHCSHWEKALSWPEGFFSPALLRYNWHVTNLCNSLRCTMCGLDALICCKMITAIND